MPLITIRSKKVLYHFLVFAKYFAHTFKVSLAGAENEYIDFRKVLNKYLSYLPSLFQRHHLETSFPRIGLGKFFDDLDHAYCFLFR